MKWLPSSWLRKSGLNSLGSATAAAPRTRSESEDSAACCSALPSLTSEESQQVLLLHQQQQQLHQQQQPQPQPRQQASEGGGASAEAAEAELQQQEQQVLEQKEKQEKQQVGERWSNEGDEDTCSLPTQPPARRTPSQPANPLHIPTLAQSPRTPYAHHLHTRHSEQEAPALGRGGVLQGASQRGEQQVCGRGCCRQQWQQHESVQQQQRGLAGVRRRQNQGAPPALP